MFYCEFYKAFKYIFFTEHLRVTASVFYIFFCSFGIKKKLSEWFSSISETLAANSVLKSFGFGNRYQYVI